MLRKNSFFSICFNTVIFFIGCSDDKTQLISNTPADLPDENYKINLQSNSGSFLETVTIYWNWIEGEVELMDSSTPNSPGSKLKRWEFPFGVIGVLESINSTSPSISFQ